MQLIDTHTHLDFEMFDDDRAQVIARARNAGVERIVVLGVHAANWQRVWQLACDEPSVHAALGLHPVFLEEHRDAHVQQLRDWLNVCAASLSLRRRRDRPDYYIDNPDIEAPATVARGAAGAGGRFLLPVLLRAPRPCADDRHARVTSSSVAASSTPSAAAGRKRASICASDSG